MNAKYYIQKLNENKLLRNQIECEEFDNALEILSNYDDKDLIEDLLLVFDDSTDEDEVMFGLIHFIEKYEMNLYLNGLIRTLPQMLSNAKDWAIILNKRILNSEQYRNAYIKVINNMGEEYKSMISNLMNEIKFNNPKKFEDSVNNLISKLNC